MYKKIISIITLATLVLPSAAFAQQSVRSWISTTTPATIIAPSAINGTNPNLIVPATGTSTFMGNLQVMGALDAVVRARTSGNMIVGGVITDMGTGSSTFVGGIDAARICVTGTTSCLGSMTSSQWTTNGLSIYYNLGNVGIGSTTPAMTLGVQGNGLFSGNVSSANITATGTATVSGAITGGTTITSTGNMQTGNGGGLYSLWDGSAYRSALWMSGSSMLVGNGTNGSLIMVSAGSLDFRPGNANKGTLDSSGNLTISGDATVSGGDLNLNNGNTAIGYSGSNGDKMAFTSFGSRAMELYQTSLKLLTTNTLGFGGISDASARASIGLSADTASGVLTFTAPTTGAFNFTGGNLGVGTSSASTFGVQGNATISGNITSVANITATGTATIGGVATFASAINTFYAGSPSNPQIKANSGSANSGTVYFTEDGGGYFTGFGVGNVNKMSLYSASLALAVPIIGSSATASSLVGNLGIGSTTPAGALGVQGNTIISGNLTSVANITATGTIAATGAISSGGAVSGSSLGSGSSVTGTSLAINGTATLPITVTTNSSVFNAGVSFLEPANGTPRGSVGYPGSSIGGFGATVALIGNAGIPITLVTNATEKVRIDTAGNMGIGTTTPPATLSIKQTANTDVIYVASSTIAVAASTTIYKIDKDGNVHFGNGTPTVSSCGTTPSLDANSTDMSGTVTFGATASGCTITFSVPKDSKPHCIVSTQAVSLVNAYTVAETASSLVITQAASGGVSFDYFCPLGH